MELNKEKHLFLSKFAMCILSVVILLVIALTYGVKLYAADCTGVGDTISGLCAGNNYICLATPCPSTYRVVCTPRTADAYSNIALTTKNARPGSTVVCQTGPAFRCVARTIDNVNYFCVLISEPNEHSCGFYDPPDYICTRCP